MRLVKIVSGNLCFFLKATMRVINKIKNEIEVLYFTPL